MQNIATFLVTAILAQFSFPYSIISCKLVHDLFDTFSFPKLFQINQIVVGVFAIIMKEIHGFFNTHPEKRKIVILAFSRFFRNIFKGTRNCFFFFLFFCVIKKKSNKFVKLPRAKTRHVASTK